MLHMTRARGLSRRDLLAAGVAAGATLVIGSGFVADATGAWALETKALAPDTVATLIHLARDIYPHDHLADRYYATAVKGHDTKAAGDADHKTLIETGIAALDGMAQGAEGRRYRDLGWEADRVRLLHRIADGGFFQAVRSDLVVSLYNQKQVWARFGYEGPSVDIGGYLDNGFDDIDWL